VQQGRVGDDASGIPLPQQQAHILRALVEALVVRLHARSVTSAFSQALHDILDVITRRELTVQRKFPVHAAEMIVGRVWNEAAALVYNEKFTQAADIMEL
jgi:hypothetical protein